MLGTLLYNSQIIRRPGPAHPVFNLKFKVAMYYYMYTVVISTGGTEGLLVLFNILGFNMLLYISFIRLSLYNSSGPSCTAMVAFTSLPLYNSSGSSCTAMVIL